MKTWPKLVRVDNFYRDKYEISRRLNMFVGCGISVDLGLGWAASPEVRDQQSSSPGWMTILLPER